MSINENLLNNINDMNRNTMLIGAAGSGKSRIIHSLSEIRYDMIKVAPSGIAAQNIKGRTIQSYFRISPYTYSIIVNQLK